MSNWRELGVIPDSEDEGDYFGDDDTLPLSLTQIPPITSAPRAQNENNIWDVPESDDDGQADTILDAPPLPLGPSSQEKPEPDTEDASFESDKDTSHNQVQPSPLNDTETCSPLHVPTFNEVVSHSNQDTEDACGSKIGDAITSSSNDLVAFASTLSTSSAYPAVSGGNDIRHDATDWEGAEVTSARRRSLRPRTLIQERPYAIELARHSNDFRQRGLVPVKPVFNSERGRLPEASQDGDFDLDSQNNDLPPGTYYSEANGFTPPLRELRTPAAAPTRPNVPQPNGQIAGNSLTSSPTNAVDEDNFDQDLPDLNQLLKLNSPISRNYKDVRQLSQIQPLTQRTRRRHIIYSDSPEPNSAVNQVPRSPGPCAEWLDSEAQQPATNKAISYQPDSLEMFPGPLTSGSVASVSSQELNNQNRHGQHRHRRKSETISEADSDLQQTVTEFRRHIRGVLPASWLRLERQTSKNNSCGSSKRNTRHRVSNQQQRGIAIIKTAAPDSTAFRALPMEPGEESLAQYSEDDMPECQSEMSSPHPSDGENDEAEAHSVRDENPIVSVVIGSKRQLYLPKTSKRNRKRAKVSGESRSQFAKSRSSQRTITGFFQSDPSEVTASFTVDNFLDNSLSSSNNYRNSIDKPKRPSKTPLLLSILDTIEPDAPRFIRIAARSAKQTINQGRSSIQKKSIKFATRQDQIDAMSVMEKWTSGLIAQRPSVSAASRPNSRRRQSANLQQDHSIGELASKTTSGTLRGFSQKFVKCRGESGFAGYRRDQPLKVTNKASASMMGESNYLPSTALREAQLELDERAGEAVVSFRSRKRTLDRIFNKQERSPWRLAENNSTLAPSYGVGESYPTEHAASRMPEGREQKSRQTRPRKSTKPRQIDITAPQYTHAADPLPADVPILINDAPSEKSKIYGLGPYGTRYSHHFEIFPLAPEVQFPKSTLLGSGILNIFLVGDPDLGVSNVERQTAVRLGDQVFIWGTWNPKVSSEIGILFDLIAERLEDSQERNLHDGRYAIDAIHSTLKYVKGALDSAETESQIPSLISRLQDVFRSFIDRLNTRLGQASSFNHAPYRQLLLNVLDRVLLMLSMMIKHCQNSPQLMTEHRNAEQTASSLALLMISVLLRCGFNKVKQIYKDFSCLNCSGRDLGEGAVEMHSWAMLIKTFEHLGSQQISFWTVLETAVLKRHILSGVDAREFEYVWETLFTLLPLFQFDDVGKIAADKRHKTENEGWSIPQKLIRRAFQLYQENDQQTASFNNYCRALISRCHYLVQQWRWLRSASVVGVIFDFFGSRRLAHLRNEAVYWSPQFLETLADEPVLSVEGDDCCFHIFLKLLAISIKKLGQFGSQKDIRNLITRTIPNHSRLYLKEHDIHERDLAALRNHHDLIATLFWAAPPDIRPSVTLIERLITPANSHKEACLINIRSWTQLARFVVSSGEARASFRPFNKWRNTLFQQMLVQFDGIAADIHQQYLTLSEDKSKFITQNDVKATISRNKAAVMDILHLSLTASLDVLRYAPDLEAATYCLNTLLLEQLFKYFTVSPFELEWSILRAALTILDTFLLAVEKFKDGQASQQSESQILNSAQADDAFLILEQDISRTYFSMARCVLSLSTETLSLMKGTVADKTWCVRQIIILSARMGIGFINGGLLRISDMFKAGKYSLFQDKLPTMDPSHRQHFALFISTLLEHRFDDFSDVDFNIFEVWVLALVVPLKYMDYENLIGIQRHCHVKGFIPNKTAESITQPSYKTNQLLFEYAVASMRKNIRHSEPSLRRALDLEYCKTLKLVMKQMRSDLILMYGDTPQHERYVTFVQHIISSIKTHGSDVCTIDNFFLQASREYSPPIEDFQLQIPGMLAYGIRIEEGDPRAAHELFFLLFNNFKHALVNGNLAQDVHMLRRGMKHKSILAFVLGKMLPAIIRVSFMDSSSFVLLDVYTEALRLLLRGRILPLQLDSNDLSHVAITTRAIVEGMRIMRLGNGSLSTSQVHILRQALTILNVLWPSLLIIKAERPGDTGIVDMSITIRHVALFATVAQGYLKDIVEIGSGSLDVDLLFQGFDIDQPLTFDMHVNSFTANIRDDIARSWILDPTRISIQMPAKLREDKQESLGLAMPTWVPEELVYGLYSQLRNWAWHWQVFS